MLAKGEIDGRKGETDKRKGKMDKTEKRRDPRPRILHQKFILFAIFSSFLYCPCVVFSPIVLSSGTLVSKLTDPYNQ
jgi:hypothetical protein